MPSIRLENVRTNNLKSISLEIDPRQLTVICGVSGSGKSSLAFDTLYAEGQRRFLETLSTSAMELLGRVPPPDADELVGVPPTIGLRQDEPVVGSHATIGSATDCTELLAIAFAQVGLWHCPQCDSPLTTSDASTVAASIDELADGTKVLIGFPTGELGSDAATKLALLQAAPISRVVIDGRLVKVRDDVDGSVGHADSLYGVVDRITAGQTATARVVESIETALRAGNGACVVLREDADGAWTPKWYRTAMSCECGYEASESLDADVLSPVRVRGTCRNCHGAGRRDGQPCGTCDGTGTGQWADLCRVGELSFRTVLLAPIAGLDASALSQTAGAVLSSIVRRRELLTKFGLGGETLSRSLMDLSSGERLRVRLASLLAADIVDTLIILDEPTAGLHPSEVGPIVDAVRMLISNGNGAVVVEHSPAFLNACDRVIEIGPFAGGQGGSIVFDGSASEFRNAETLTSNLFSHPNQASMSEDSERPQGQYWSVVVFPDKPAIDFPVGALTVITGLSGSGKSTLLKALARETTQQLTANAEATDVESCPFQGVQLVEQQPFARSSRSCLAMHTKAFDEIRKLFASVPEAAAHGLQTRHFSFNAAGGGRCPHCSGRGDVLIPMGHISDILMVCPVCSGSRYESTVLNVKFRRRSIADVLAMTVDDAVAFFRTEPAIRRKLQPVRDVGLGYVTLGQPLSSLSGGEAQRLHLARYLTPNSRGPVLFLLDEPARGLHPADQKTLADVFDRLTDVGHTLVIAEHHPTLVARTQWLVELNESGVGYAGTLSEFAQHASGPIADFVRQQIAFE